MGGPCSMHWRNAHNTVVFKPEGKRSLSRSRCEWENNIGMYLKEIGYDELGWIHMVQNRDRWQTVVNMVMNLRFHKRRIISGLAERLSTSQGGLRSI
jgi:hypothetical protein